MNRRGMELLLFSELFSKSGGEDTEFFLRLGDNGYRICWCADAVVYEDIPKEKATPEFVISRFMTQGRTYRDILVHRGEIRSKPLFLLRDGVFAIISISIANCLLPLMPKMSASWFKRGYSNLGKIIHPGVNLYE